MTAVNDSPKALDAARSFLFVPGHQAARIAKAVGSSADAIVIDLEDAVPLDAKVAAWEVINAIWPSLPDSARRRILIRVNPSGTPWHEADLGLLARLEGLGGAMLPKAESAAQIARVVRDQPRLCVLPLIETATGLAQIDAIASAPSVLRLGLGHIDLQADLGMAAGPDGYELLPARWALVLASRRAGLPPPVDGVTTSTSDAETWLADAQASRRLGFGAKLCIHPVQIDGVHAGFAPTAHELEWARRVLDAEQRAGGGAFSVDGKMVDPPVVLLARQLLERAA